jgi:hypothetical protein
MIELFFPIFFIFAGLALSTIKFLRDGHPRSLSPTIFPSPNQLYYNTPVALGDGDPNSFVTNYFTRNLTEWSSPHKVDITKIPGDYESMISELDDEIFK